MLQCHNIVNSKTLLLQFLSYVQETKYCVAGKQADIIPDSKIINCKQTKLLFLIKISWLVFKRKGLKSYKFNSKTKTNAKTNALYKIILLFRICFKSCSISKFQLQSAISLLREQFDLETIVLNSHTCNWYWLDELIADKINRPMYNV